MLERIGSGGMGTVFVAYDPDLDRRIALKVLHRRGGRGSDHEAALREGRALARLRHPNVVTVYEVGIVDDQVFVAMEHVAGPSLREWARAEPSPGALTSRLLEAGRGIAAAHAVGVVHHDFKPDNVVIDASGQSRIVDFGLARALDDVVSTSADKVEEGGSSAWNRGGTPAYMAPERLAGEPGGRRSDQYSFAVSCWELLCGERPSPASPRPARLSGRVQRALRRALDPDPAARFATMEELLSELEPRPSLLRRFGPAAVVVALIPAAFLALPGAQGEGQRCASPWALLSTTWDERRSDALAAAFLATGAPFADETWASVRSRLDRYATAWTDAHTRACEDTAVLGVISPAEYERRLLCLEDRRLHLEAMVERFAVADLETVTRAHQAVDSLPAIDACGGPEGTEWIPGGEPAQVSQHLALRQESARARAELNTGDLVVALERIDRLLERVETLGDPALIAEIQNLAGRADEAKTDYSAALEHRRAALRFAVAEGQPITAAQAASSIASMQIELSEDYATSELMLDLAEAYAHRGGDPPRISLQINASRGLVLRAKHECDRAIETWTETRRIALELDEPQLAAWALNSRSFCRSTLGDYAGEVRDLRQALIEHETLFGPLHSQVATIHSNLGSAYMALPDRDRAIEHISRAAEIVRANFGEEHLVYAATTMHLGALHATDGDHEAALADFRRSTELLAGLLGEEHPTVALGLCASGSQLLALGRPEEGLATARRGAAIYAERVDMQDCDRQMCAAVRGEILLDLARPADALAVVEPALDGALASSCPPEQRGDLELLLARSLWQTRGVTESARVLELLDAVPDTTPDTDETETEKATAIAELREAVRRALADGRRP